MALEGMPDFQAPIEVKGVSLLAPYGGAGAFTLVPGSFSIKETRSHADITNMSTRQDYGVTPANNLRLTVPARWN
jgi:hypothetical protein